MTLLNFDNGESFATGAMGYDYRPATKTETTNRIFLEVEIQGIPTQAVVDTGAPYVPQDFPVVSPRILTPSQLIEELGNLPSKR